MKAKILNKNIFFFFIIIKLLLLNSCISTKDVKYLQNKNNLNDTINYVKKERYIVKCYDYLFIKLTSIDPDINRIINPDNFLAGSASGAMSKYKDIYMVNDSGYIELTLTGKIFVKNMTIDEIKRVIENKINYKQVMVTVRLSEFPITIIGQVNRPGHYLIDNEKFSIFELIGVCGDLLINANRQNIKLVRQTEQGTQIYILDLTDKKILNSEYFYLKPFDVVYVEPHYATFLESNKFPFISTISLILTTTTSIVFYLNYFNN